ncbi:MAG: VCBS repeat-containing protein [Nannocystaceae bacterium]
MDVRGVRARSTNFIDRLVFARPLTTGIAVGYVNRDEYPDLIISSSISMGSDVLAPSLVTVRTGDGDEGVVTSEPVAVFELGLGDSPIILVDVDNDGRHDVVRNKTFAFSKANGSFTDPDTIISGVPVGGSIWGHIDSDKTTDVAFISPEFGSVHTLLGKNGGGYREAVNTEYDGPDLDWRVFGDATGNGHADIVGLNIPVSGPGGDEHLSGVVMLVEGDGGGHFVTDDSRTIHLQERTVHITGGDFNCDSMIDIAIAISAPPHQGAVESNRVQVYLASDDGWEGPIDIKLPAPVHLAVGDVNGDGAHDILVANHYYNTVDGSLSDEGRPVVLLGKGDGSFDELTLESAAPVGYFGSIQAGDVNGDGLDDVLAGHMLPGGNSVSVWISSTAE